MTRRWLLMLHKGYEDNESRTTFSSAAEAENAVGAASVPSCRSMYASRICLRTNMAADRTRSSFAFCASSTTSFQGKDHAIPVRNVALENRFRDPELTVHWRTAQLIGSDATFIAFVKMTIRRCFTDSVTKLDVSVRCINLNPINACDIASPFGALNAFRESGISDELQKPGMLAKNCSNSWSSSNDSSVHIKAQPSISEKAFKLILPPPSLCRVDTIDYNGPSSRQGDPKLHS
ncbi:hypothetical protein B0F90DRAFT_1669893 [Multifurca ochricompacta]|uniref:Uncharacterized protein n=1 Tax=Multifurca ochricompacta TaxID=376703 RepID=A0AAD4QLA4_9AGAM|nr:hypothetical protein B0F90DRAFT_1669893 [Multifurca ochricompacta]